MHGDLKTSSRAAGSVAWPPIEQTEVNCRLVKRTSKLLDQEQTWVSDSGEYFC